MADGKSVIAGENPLVERYVSALSRHARTPDEDSLAQAWTLGRTALDAGMSLLDLWELHVFAGAALSTGEPDARVALTSPDFFREAIAPYEMALRGFRDANEGLRVANVELATRNAELTRARSAAEAATRELDAFSYSVSHDLRAPLRAIDGFTKVILEDYGAALGAEGGAYLHRVVAAAERMSHLIDDLLRLSRVAASAIDRARVDVTAIAYAVIGRLRTGDPAREVVVHIEPALTAEGDARLVEIVFENLIGNAWKFSSGRSPARIDVGATGAPRDRQFFVRDNGAGFDASVAARLFAPFARFHHASDFPGHGIGLATVQRIVHRHEGRIWADSAADQGATFWFTLSSNSRPPGEKDA